MQHINTLWSITWILFATLLSTLSIRITAKTNLRQQRLRDRTATSEDTIYQLHQDIDIGAMDEDDVDSKISPTSNPLYKDTISPTNNPLEDKQPPSYSPTTAMPTYYPTRTWDGTIIEPPVDNNPYFFGSELIEIPELGIEISKGLSVKFIAKTGQRVTFANGTKSSYRWHKRSDGAGIVPLNTTHPLEGGYVYLSNSDLWIVHGQVWKCNRLQTIVDRYKTQLRRRTYTLAHLDIM